MSEVPIIRCLGLNYKDHAREANMPIPEVPVLFIKPRTAISGPFPASVNIPKTAQDDTSDYEAELSFVIGKTGRDIAEADALDYVLGYTCSNDVSARAQQFKNSQWCFSKGKIKNHIKYKVSVELMYDYRFRWLMPIRANACIAISNWRSP